MGLGNWLMKNGPGSPGDTAKYYVKAYNKITEGATSNHEQDWPLIFSDIFILRYGVIKGLGFAEGCLLKTVNPSKIIEASEGDLALFIFYMMLAESPQFKRNLISSFDQATNAIYEVVKQRAPLTLKYSLSTFRLKASFGRFHF